MSAARLAERGGDHRGGDSYGYGRHEDSSRLGGDDRNFDRPGPRDDRRYDRGPPRGNDNRNGGNDEREAEYWRERRERRTELYKLPCEGRVWARSPTPPEHSDDDEIVSPTKSDPQGAGGVPNKRVESSVDTDTDASDDEHSRRRKHRHKSKRGAGSDNGSESESDNSDDSDSSQSRKRAKREHRHKYSKKHHKKHSKKRHKKHSKKKHRRRKHKHSDAASSDREDSAKEDEQYKRPTNEEEEEGEEDEWVEAEPADATVKKTNAEGDEQNEEEEDEEEDDVIGPQPPQAMRLNRRTIGDRMLKGEADAIANYVEEGQRIPRRGEIGLTPDQIADFEAQGYIMSGSRNVRMEAVRLRKENEVYDAERQRQMALANQEAREKKNNALIAEMRDFLHKQHKKIVKEHDPTKAAAE